MKLQEILTELKENIENDIQKSPTWYLDKAVHLNILWQDLKEELTKYEILYKQDIVKNMEKNSVAKATLLTEASSESYRTYLLLRGRDKIVEEYIRIMKKRATREYDYS